MTNGLTDDAIAAYAAQLLDLEADIETLQGDKKGIYTNLRETYGKRAADALKLAIKRYRMDAGKREAADEVDAEAERFLTIIREPRAPRATHAHARVREAEAAGADIETGEIIEPTGNGAGGAEGEAVANDAKPSAQHSEPVRGAGTVADGAGKPETSDASSADIPMSNASAQPNGADPRTPVDAATVGETADHSEPAEVPPPSAAPGDGSAVIPSAAPVVANVVQLRSYNPETHFLNAAGLPRLHGCLKPDMCGSSQPRAKLCFSCSVKHDGPTFQAVAE